MSRREESLHERQERVGRNEALFRTVNENLEGLNETFSVLSDEFAIVCECGYRDCIQQLTIPTDDLHPHPEEPDAVRPRPGHQDPTSEAVVD
jgi:hypothetical protein